MDQPVVDRHKTVLGIGFGGTRVAPHRTSYVALLRDVRNAAGQCAASGQFPGRSEAGRRAPNVPTHMGLYLVSDIQSRQTSLSRHMGTVRGEGGKPTRIQS